jgi:hypothetical protein
MSQNENVPLPNYMALVDVNADQKVDLVLADGVSHGVSVLLGEGNGSFGTAKLVNVGAAAKSIAAADFDGDGRIDLAVANGSQVSVIPGNGDGTFKAGQDFPALGETYVVAAGDMNDDGKQDLAYGDLTHNAVAAMWGRGNGLFDNAGSIPLGGIPTAIAIGDLDGDGATDVAAGGDGLSRLWMSFNARQGLGLYTKDLSIGSAASIVIADFNGDKKVDMAVAATYDVAVVLAGSILGCF